MKEECIIWKADTERMSEKMCGGKGVVSGYSLPGRSGRASPGTQAPKAFGPELGKDQTEEQAMRVFQVPRVSAPA